MFSGAHSLDVERLLPCAFYLRVACECRIESQCSVHITYFGDVVLSVLARKMPAGVTDIPD